ncbi:hypothetical protein AA101099_0296 [Neoasaia chiangmaiensis NBRC 101099]|uniref:Uncharacterized protein n=1 Tax=Neoasaia chiangmaiensis TaxID=320497 RepID=A0A1U9KRY7_9PROT|nr:hypothetical protein [Neoasaia chiangmaiensis]AQS88568.1 hypothetical protein A0U93_12185 [Neoasaia chiangmaiensis]GBR36267.1 hypothetical protein AA101099_0296 [Neoasaia chiangmaiensis NBRC 101099]GEN15410.1 hypothetical protein NCH01_18410 [Neoasaia chiangmaiensis]
MRAVSCVLPVLTLAFGIGTTLPVVAAKASPVSHDIATASEPANTDDAATGRHLDMDNRAPLRCAPGANLVRTAYEPDRKPISLHSCFSATERIGAGYTSLLSTSAVRHPHHRLRG